MENQENQENPVSQPNESNNSLLLFGGLIFLGVVLVGGYFFMNRNKTNTATNKTAVVSTPTTTVENETVTNEETTELGNSTTSVIGAEDVISIEGGSFYFKPNVINAKVGQPVKIKFTTVGNMPHDFVVDEFDVKTEQITNDTLEFEFTPTKAGTFEFYCSVGSHRKMGMKGSLIVE